MFTVKGNKVEGAGILFSLPEGFYFNTEHAEDRGLGGLHLSSPEGDCSICLLENEAEYDSAMDSLMDIFGVSDDVDMFSKNDTGYIWEGKPHIKRINGISCAAAKYESCGKQCYELHFERLKGKSSQLEVWLEMKKAHNDEKYKKNLQEFYESFEPEKNV